MLQLISGGYIPPMTTENMEIHCELNENKTIYPFAFIAHTHSHGVMEVGYHVRNLSQWTIIGKRDPRLPQGFFPTVSQEPIRPGDILAARCTMENLGPEVVKTG